MERVYTDLSVASVGDVEGGMGKGIVTPEALSQAMPALFDKEMQGVNAKAYSNLDEALADGIESGQTYPEKLRTGEFSEVSQISGSGEFGYALSFSGDGSILAVIAKTAGTVQLYSISDGVATETASASVSDPTSVSISRDGFIVAVGSGGSDKVTLFGVLNGSLTSPFEYSAHAGEGFGELVNLNEDGSVLDVGTSSGAIVYVHSVSGVVVTETSAVDSSESVSGHGLFGRHVDVNDEGDLLAYGDHASNVVSIRSVVYEVVQKIVP